MTDSRLHKSVSNKMFQHSCLPFVISHALDVFIMSHGIYVIWALMNTTTSILGCNWATAARSRSGFKATASRTYCKHDWLATTRPLKRQYLSNYYIARVGTNCKDAYLSNLPWFRNIHHWAASQCKHHH